MLFPAEISEPSSTDDSVENHEVLMDSDLTETDQIDPEMYDLPPSFDEEYLSDNENESGVRRICRPWYHINHGLQHPGTTRTTP